MIIDFHTHMFPDKIVARTIDFLSKTGQDMRSIYRWNMERAKRIYKTGRY